MNDRKRLNFFKTLCCAILFAPALFAQRDTIALNTNWQFAVDKSSMGVNNKWFEKSLPSATTVSLPHTWNVEAENQNHYGWGWYQNKLNVPTQWKEKSVVLQFGAINHTAHIYINGQKVAEHIGDGFNKFYVPLDGKLVYGKVNTITVAANNDWGKNKVPFGSSFDWPNDGGLIRPVSLIVTGKPAATYLHAVPVLNVATNEGSLQLKLGMGEANKNIRLRVTVSEDNQPTNNVVLTKVEQPVWIDGKAMVNFRLPKVNPWHFDAPNLYRIDVTVMNGKKAVDKITTHVGFRDFKFENGKTYLNGEHVKLMGVEWTAGSNPDFGFAETEAEILRHCRLMKDVNTIFTRQHFQQDDVFYDFCDRNGILLQQEVPLWGPETPANETIRTIAVKQLEQMISNHYNHPSIFGWGVGNELRGRDPKMKQMIEDLIAKARKLDSTRYVGYVSNTLKDGFSNHAGFVPDAGSLGDYLMMNEYGGSWWDVPVGKIHTYLDSIHTSYPGKPFFISEFGLCEPNFKGGDERRLEDLVYHMAIYETKPFIEGAIYFDLTDYRTHYPGTHEQNKYRRRIHGIYDMWGKPKPSMKVLRELSSPIEVQGLRSAGNGILNVLLFGSIGLPQHNVTGYTLYISDKEDNYKTTKAYKLPQIKPGERIEFTVDDLYKGGGIITIVRPTGFVVSQKSFF